MRTLTRNTLALAVAILPTTLVAQGLTVHSVADMHFQGALGTMMNFAAKLGGANMREMPTTTYLSGHKMRTESENTGMIVDLDAERLTSFDNKNKTYTSMTFTELADAMARAAESAKQKRDEAVAKAKEKENKKDPNAPKGEMNVKYKAQVDRTGQKEKVAGYDAERVFITITMEGEATPEGGKTEQVGSLVLLLDQWISKDAPQIAALQEFRRAYVQKVGQEFRSQQASLQQAFAFDPRLKDGLAAAAKELQKVPGISLRSMTYVTAVPAGMAFDRQLALNDVAANAKEEAAKKDEKGGGGIGGLMGRLKSAAEQANKNPPPDKNAPPKQGTLLSMKDEVQTINVGPVAADMFAPPAGYREVKPQYPR
jgi:hypothetical protein